MAGNTIFATVMTMLGGLAVFILGMGLMTEGLQRFAGQRIRRILAAATRHRLNGIVLGTVLGFLVHSSAATVMLVGFINAGLMTLAESIPPILGANIGTTLSMQLISLRLGSYCYLFIVAGLLLRLSVRRESVQHLGRTLLGFGLLFLGMNIMGDSVSAHRDTLGRLLVHVDGRTWRGMLLGVGAATVFTGIIQSSGATIGMAFVLIKSGVFTDLGQVYPIVLGAHIGTCMTALLGSIGTNVDARRSAVAHLVFNLSNVTLAVAAAPFVQFVVQASSPHLLHQTANLHTGVMLFSGLALLPFSRYYAALIARIVPSRHPVPQPSFLDRALLDRPESALAAAIRELQRTSRICQANFRLNGEAFFDGNSRRSNRMKLFERAVNDVKLEFGDYLTALTARHLSRRQAVLLQYADQCMVQVERINDHIDAMRKLSEQRHQRHDGRFDRATLDRWFDLYREVERMLKATVDSLDVDRDNFAAGAVPIHRNAEAFDAKRREFVGYLTAKTASREFAPIISLYLNEYLSSLRRIVRHIESIADVESKPDFWIKGKRLERVQPLMPDHTPPPPERAEDFLNHSADVDD